MVLAVDAIDLNEVKKNATYSLPVAIWHWLKEQGVDHEDGASGVIADLVRNAQKDEAA